MEKMKFDFQLQPGKERTRFYAPDPKDAMVSIFTPFYNAGKYFEQTFNSVMNQTFPWFEWIIVNDGSTKQEDVELLHRLAATDRRIRVVTQPNGGLSCARNTGIANASTDLVVPLDADDVLAPTYVECLYWAMHYNPDAAWGYTNSYGFQEKEYIWREKFDAERLKTYNFLNYVSMIRKPHALDIGGYKVEKWAYYEDWRFWLEMLGKDKKPVHVASNLFWYRRLSGGMLSTINNNPERKAFADGIIAEAASHANGSIQAKEYPVACSAYPFQSASFLPWERKSYERHDKKRVLWLIPWLNMGGADKFNLDAMTGLQQKGVQNFILTTQATEQHEWQQKFEAVTDEIFHLPDFLDPLHYPEFLSYFIQSREIDAIIVSNSYEGYYLIPWIRQHFPQVVITDYVHMEEWYWRNGGYARTSGAAAGLTEKTWVCNSATRDVMIRNFGRKPASVDCMYIGVDHNHFCADLEQPGYLHEMLKLDRERPIILFPCRIHPQKRPFMMLSIANKVRKQIPNAAFVVVGDGPQLDELEKTAADMGLENTVYCIGRSENMRACYRDSDLTLICSLKEGLALTAYESLSMGVPVVSSDVGGQRDLIGSDVGALIPFAQSEDKDLDSRSFPEDEVELYVHHIVGILRDDSLRRQLSENGRRKIEEGFSIEKMIEQLYREIHSLCDDPIAAENRRALSANLQSTPSFASDYYTIYLQWKIQQEECETIWKGRCWFESQAQALTAQLEAERNLPFKTLLRRLLGKIKRKLFRIFRIQY